MEITALTAICAKILLWKMPNIWFSIALISYFKDFREHIFLDLSESERLHGINVFTPTENNFHLVMWKAPPGVNYDITFEMYGKIASSVHLMY